MSGACGRESADLLHWLRRLRHEPRLGIRRARRGAHTKVTLNHRSTVVPRHGKDLKTGTLRAILKQLGPIEHDLEV
jgi:hypothetical protein